MSAESGTAVDPKLERAVLSWLEAGSYRKGALVGNLAKTTPFERDEIRSALETLATTDAVEYHPNSGLYRRSTRRDAGGTDQK